MSRVEQWIASRSVHHGVSVSGVEVVHECMQQQKISESVQKNRFALLH